VIYEIDMSYKKQKTKLISGNFKMGGKNPEGIEINVNNQYFTRDKKPWLPIMGEFHFSRYPNDFWESELLKMKAGGIQIVSTYVFWIHHEEKEGYFDWSDNKNLRRFVKLCSKHGLYTYPRIGPWCHGECRNGGFPDWLYDKCTPRTNDLKYLRYVHIFYSQIAKQLEGLLFKDGGPIIGIQLENELIDNPSHLLILKKIAQEVGLEVPLYTATGWGENGAKIPENEILPAFGAYPDQPWAQHIKKLPPQPHYFFHHMRNDTAIGCDLFNNAKMQESIDSDFIECYPYITCEIGPGVQVTYHRRPIIEADDVGAMVLTKIGSGVNLLGYYVYHGGSNPIGKTTMQETRDTGYPNDLPIISYDFQAPLGEFGQVREHYHILRQIHLFLKDFGEDLAPMISILPEDKPFNLEDIDTLRFAARIKGRKGYVFFNNYQRSISLPDKKNLKIKLKLEDEVIIMPDKGFTLESGAYFFWPFNMEIEEALLKYATVQPLCKIINDHETVYFFSETQGIDSEYIWVKKTIKSIEIDGDVNVTYESDFIKVSQLRAGTNCVINIKTINNRDVRVVTLTRCQALNAWKEKVLGEERLVLSQTHLAFERDSIILYGTNSQKMGFSVFPDFEEKMHCDVFLNVEQDGIFKRYTPIVDERKIPVQFELKSKPIVKSDLTNYLFIGKKQEHYAPEWNIQLPKNLFDDINDAFLKIYYIGDIAQMYIGDKLIADDFYTGKPWEISLKRFETELEKDLLTLKISPLYKGAWIYLEEWPVFDREKIVDLLEVEIMPEYKIKITKSDE